MFSLSLNFIDVLSKTVKPISSYELLISGLVHTLLCALSPPAAVLNNINNNNQMTTSTPGDDLTTQTTTNNEKCAERVQIFVRTFIADPVAFNLLHKLMGLLESVEKLPLYLYDAPGSYNLQAFSKRFKLILNKGNKEQNFLDFSGRVLKVEPLANISHLEKYIAKMVTKQWYDYERSAINCLTLLNTQVTQQTLQIHFGFTNLLKLSLSLSLSQGSVRIQILARFRYQRSALLPGHERSDELTMAQSVGA